jgi:hypothetical protein
MRRYLALSAAVLVASTTAMVVPSFAGAVSEEDTMVIDPSEGPPGTEIAVSGEGCQTKGDVEVDVVLLDTEGVQQDGVTVTPSGDGFGGEWDATVTVPADTTDFGEWTVDAICWFIFPEDVAVPAGDPAVVDYTDLPFLVTEPVVAPEDPEVPEPPAAAPAAAAPDFTG